MSTSCRLMSAVAAAAFAVTIGASAFGQQTKDQAGCINAMNKDGAKVGKAQGKENSACVKTGTKGAVAALCPTADAKGKVAKKKSKTTADAMGKCVADVPDFAFTSATTVNNAYQGEELNLLADMFGSTDLSAVISTDKGVGGCQAAVAKGTEKVAAAAGKGFVKCKKDALKDPAVDVLDIQNCVGNDAKGKVAKAATKLGSDITKKCGSVTQATAFPGGCASASNLGNCLSAKAKCRMCLAANAADNVLADCDTIDDGMANGSCGGCPLVEGIYTVTQIAGGTLTVDGLGAFPFPTGGTIVEHVGAATPPLCLHDVVVPSPGGFSAPVFCIPGLNFSVMVVQDGCGIGRIDSNGGSDFTVTEEGDTSSSGAGCFTQACTNGVDSHVRVDITVGNGMADMCSGGGQANALVSIPVHTTTWVHSPTSSCPDPDGMPGGPGDLLIVEFDQVLDFTTDTNSGDWSDLDGDGCCLAGAGPGTAGPGSVSGSCSTTGGTAGLSGTGACMNVGAGTVTTAASGAIGSSGGPLFDLSFTTTLPNTVTGPSGLPTASCAMPPAINFSGTVTRCN